MNSNLQKILPKIENISFKNNEFVVDLGFTESSMAKMPWFRNRKLLDKLTFRTIICTDTSIAETFRAILKTKNEKSPYFKYFTSYNFQSNDKIIVKDNEGEELFSSFRIQDVTSKNKEYYLKREITFNRNIPKENVYIFSGFFISDKDYNKSIYLYSYVPFITNFSPLNERIKDLTLFDKKDQIGFDFKSEPHNLLKSNTTNLVSNISISQDSSCFSELMFNRTDTKSFQVLFWMDILGLFKKHSQFSNLLNKREFSKFFIENGFGKIKELALYRQKTNPNKYETNGLSTNLNRKIIDENYNRELVIKIEDISSPNNGINVISLDEGTVGKKLFTIKDLTFNKTTIGSYSYSLELTLQDLVYSLLETITERLKSNLDKFSVLEHMITKYDLYDHSGEFFQSKFFSVAETLEKNLLRNIVSDLLQVINQISTIAVDERLYSLLSNKNNFNMFVFNGLKDLYLKILSQLELAIGSLDKSSQSKVSSVKGIDKNISISYDFKENFDSILNQNYFAEFLDYKNLFVPTISKADLSARFEKEFLKYYSTIKINNVEKNYITSSNIVYGNKNIDNGSYLINNLNYRKYSEALIEYIQLKFHKTPKPVMLDGILNILNDFNFNMDDLLSTDNNKLTENFLLNFIKSSLFNEEGLASLFRFSNKDENNILDEIKDISLPVQIRSVIDSFKMGGLTRNNLETDPFTDIDKMFSLFFTYKIIGRIKFANGFKNNSTNINWVDLDDQTLSSNKSTLCKIDYFINSKFGIPENEILHNLEILGRYFILQ